MTSTTTAPDGPCTLLRPSPSGEEALLEFAGGVLAAGDATAPECSFQLTPGGVRVRIRIAGAELARRLRPGLEPLAVPVTGTPDVDVVAWDEHAGERELPHLPWDADAPGDRFATRGTVQMLHARSAGTLSVLDAATGRAAFWTRDAGQLPRWETAAPFRTLLRWALRGHGLHMLHGAVVVGARGGALLAGRSGAGKSTTALAATQTGLGYVGDDYCVVDEGTPPRVHSLCAVGKLDAEGLRLLPALRRHVLEGATTPDGKEILVPRGLVRDAALQSIVLPRVAEAAGPLVPARPAEALSALATSLLLLPGSRQEDFAPLGAVVRALPAYSLAVGPDPAVAAATLLDHLGGPS